MTDPSSQTPKPETDQDERTDAPLQTPPKPAPAKPGMEPAAPATGGAGSAGAGGPKGFGTGS